MKLLKRNLTDYSTISSGTDLTGGCVPNFERVVIGSRHDGVARELQAGDDVLIVTTQDSGLSQFLETPVGVDAVSSQKHRLKERQLVAKHLRNI